MDFWFLFKHCDKMKSNPSLFSFCLSSSNAVVAATPMIGGRVCTFQSMQRAGWCPIVAARPSLLSVARETTPPTSTRWRSVNYSLLENKKTKWRAPYSVNIIYENVYWLISVNWQYVYSTLLAVINIIKDFAMSWYFTSWNKMQRNAEKHCLL